MKYAVLHVPAFPLHALRCAEPGLRNKPTAIIAGEGKNAVLAYVSPEAEGVEPNLAVPIAMARSPGIVLRTRDVNAEAEAMRLVVAAAFSLSPRVEITSPGTCTVDLQGADPERTEAAMRLRVTELTRMGLPAKAGAAETPLIAWYAAQCADPLLVVREKAGFLANLPLAFAEPTLQQSEVLREWGIQFLGQLTALPKDEVGKRLGSDGASLWERASGEAFRVLCTTSPSRTFISKWEYEPPIENIEPLFFKLRRYAEMLAYELRGAGFVAEALMITLQLENDTDYRREFRLAEANTNIESWLKVLHSHFESLTLEARVIEVTFLAKPTRPVVRQDGLFDTGLRDPHAFWENLARVEAVLGPGRIGTPTTADTWKTDSFTLERPSENIPPADPQPIHGPRGGIIRRIRPPIHAFVETQAGKPVSVHGFIEGAFTSVSGPWKADGDWWQPGTWSVEIWHGELPPGVVYQLALTPKGWVIEGIID